MSVASGSRVVQRLDAIDILRAVAMTMVVAQHSGILPFGWTGVWLFYVISGYVIARGLSNFDGTRQAWLPSAGHFLQARVARLLPALLVYLAAVGVVAAFVQARGVLEHYPFLLSFTFNWRMVFLDWTQQAVWSPLGHLWTLSVEQQFYLLFPILAFGVPARRRLAACLVLMTLGPALRLLTSMAVSDWPDIGARAFAIYASTFGHVDAFLAGASIAYARAAGVRLDRWAVPLGGVAVMSVAAYALFAVAANRTAGAHGIDLVRNVFSGNLYGAWREVLVYVPVVLVGSWLVLKASAVANERIPSAARWLASVGRASFSGYLWHAGVLWALTTAWPAFGSSLPGKVLLFVCAWTVTMALAAMSYCWVEQPGLRLLKPARGHVRKTGAMREQGLKGG